MGFAAAVSIVVIWFAFDPTAPHATLLYYAYVASIPVSALGLAAGAPKLYISYRRSAAARPMRR